MRLRFTWNTSLLLILRRVQRQHIARQIMIVTMVMVIESNTLGGARAEKGDIFGMGADRLGRARTANMTVQTKHPVGRAHHHVEIVADHQYTAATRLAQPLNELEHTELALEIDLLRWLVQHQKVRIA